MKKYITPCVEINETEAFEMIALSLLNGNANSDKEVLGRNDSWNIWNEDEDED